MKDNKQFTVPFHKTHITQEEIEAVVLAMKSGWLTMGPKTLEFEEKFREYLGVGYALSTNSATSALHLALKAIGIKEGDEVIVPTNTFIATAEVVTYFNAIPVLCDIEEDTFNLDVSKVEALITPKTKAVIPVHYGGQPCDMDELKVICRKYELKIIEDAAHALPSSYKGRKIGTIGDITCFSFYATKPLSTGEGGMVVTNNREWHERMKVNRLHGISKDAWDRYTAQGSWYYEVVENGHKYNTTDLNAAMGLVQLRKVESLRDKRAEIAKLYNQAFKDSNIRIPFLKDDRNTSWHLYPVLVENRNKVIQELKENDIGASVHFIPVHKHPYYKNKYHYQNENYPVANKIFEQTLSLPIYPDMSMEEVNYVADKLKEIVKN